MSGYLHAPAFDTRAQEAGLAVASVLMIWRRENLLPVPRIETRFISYGSRSWICIPTAVSWYLTRNNYLKI